MAAITAILDCRSARFYLLLIYKSHWCFPASLESIGLSVQEKKRKIDFQDGGHLGFPISTILATFDLQVTLMLPSKFEINWPFGSGEEMKNRFSRWRPWRPSCISYRHDLTIFDLQVTLILPSKFGVNWPFGSGEDAKNRFSRWLPWRPSWISDWHDFSYFWSTSHPDASYQVWSQLAFRFRNRNEK